MLVDFYHLEASPIDRVLPSICEKILGNRDKLLLVAESGELARLDDVLWTYSKDSFLPHARSERANPELQPILLSDTPEPLNGATNIALGDGRWRDEALGFARTFYLFGSAQLGPARTAWRALKGNAAVEPRYWKQDEGGKWVQGP